MPDTDIYDCLSAKSTWTVSASTSCGPWNTGQLLSTSEHLLPTSLITGHVGRHGILRVQSFLLSLFPSSSASAAAPCNPQPRTIYRQVSCWHLTSPSCLYTVLLKSSSPCAHLPHQCSVSPAVYKAQSNHSNLLFCSGYGPHSTPQPADLWALPWRHRAFILWYSTKLIHNYSKEICQLVLISRTWNLTVGHGHYFLFCHLHFKKCFSQLIRIFFLVTRLV